MKENKNNQKGITLIALVITIIVLIIIAGISIGQISGRNNSINESEEKTAFSELTKIQQAIIERYIKYKQFGNKNVLIGEELDYDDAQTALTQVKNGEQLKVDNRDSAEYKYYKLNKGSLKLLGLENIHNSDEYIVNYSTGEVFNITQKKTANDGILYIYSKKEIGGDYIKNGLVLYLDGIDNTRQGHDDNSDVWEDLSGNRNDGTISNPNNSIVWNTNCFSFDSIDDKVIVPESNTISPIEQTIEVVLKANGASLNSSNGTQIFFVKWQGYTMELNSNRTFSYGRKSGYLRTTSSIDYGKIYSIVANHENNTSKIYLNNNYENKQTVEPMKYSGMNYISIGNYGNSNRFFNGNIYVIRMYNRALTDEEIAHNYEIDKSRFGIEE